MCRTPGARWSNWFMSSAVACVVGPAVAAAPHTGGGGGSLAERVAWAASVDEPAVAWRLFEDPAPEVRKALAANTSPALSKVITKMASSNDASSEIALANPSLPEQAAVKFARSVCHPNSRQQWRVEALLAGECSEALLLTVAEGEGSTAFLLEKAAAHPSATEQVRAAVLRNRNASLPAMTAAVRRAESPGTVSLLFDDANTERTWRDALDNTERGTKAGRRDAHQLLSAVVAAPAATADHLHAAAVASTVTHGAVLARGPLLPETLRHIGFHPLCDALQALRVAKHPCTDEATLLMMSMRDQFPNAADTARKRLVERRRDQRAVERAA